MDNIFSALFNLQNNLNSLLEAALLKQRALVNLNHEELENAIIKEEKLMNAVRESEQARINALEQFYSEHAVSHETYKISELCAKFKPGTAEAGIKKLRTLEKRIKNAIREINKVNHQNIYIIQHSRAFIKETISSLISTNKSFLDKRV